jgi:hypothetical protein
LKFRLGEFNAKVGRENIFKLTIGKQSLHQDINDNGVRIVNFAMSKYPVVKSTMYPHQNIHKYIWTSPDGKNCKQIDFILIYRIWHSSILDVQSFRRADCDTDYYQVVTKIRERLAVSKETSQKFDVGIFNLRKLNELYVRKEHKTEITNRFAALENLNDVEDINRVWENNKQNIKTSATKSLVCTN